MLFTSQIFSKSITRSKAIFWKEQSYTRRGDREKGTQKEVSVSNFYDLFRKPRICFAKPSCVKALEEILLAGSRACVDGWLLPSEAFVHEDNSFVSRIQKFYTSWQRPQRSLHPACNSRFHSLVSMSELVPFTKMGQLIARQRISSSVPHQIPLSAPFNPHLELPAQMFGLPHIH